MGQIKFIVAWFLGMALCIVLATAGYGQELPQSAQVEQTAEDDPIEEGFNQLEQLIQQIRSDNSSLIDRNQNLSDGFDQLEALAWAQGNEINRQIELNRQKDAVVSQQNAVTEAQAAQLRSTLFSNKVLRVSLYVGVPVALVGGGLIMYFIMR